MLMTKPASGTGRYCQAVFQPVMGSVPLAGFVMSRDSIFFLTGVLKPGDLLYSEPEIDYTQSVIYDKKKAKGGAK